MKFRLKRIHIQHGIDVRWFGDVDTETSPSCLLDNMTTSHIRRFVMYVSLVPFITCNGIFRPIYDRYGLGGQHSVFSYLWSAILMCQWRIILPVVSGHFAFRFHVLVSFRHLRSSLHQYLPTSHFVLDPRNIRVLTINMRMSCSVTSTGPLSVAQNVLSLATRLLFVDTLQTRLTFPSRSRSDEHDFCLPA